MSLSDTFKAISDPVRREILEMLRNERKSAGEIAQKFNLTNATVSYHLAQLKKADLVICTLCQDIAILDEAIKEINSNEILKEKNKLLLMCE